jgi:hypothetical protein
LPSIELSITDNYQLGSLESVLRREMPELAVSRSPGAPEPGALGWEDVLILTFAGISAFKDVVDLVRSYLDTRRQDTDVTITATNSTSDRTQTLVVRNATDAQVTEFVNWLTHE